MTSKLFTVYDSKAEAFLQPVYAKTVGIFMRMVAQAVNDPNHDFHKTPGDYTFFEIGEWDDASGMIRMLESRINLGGAIELLENIAHNQRSGDGERLSENGLQKKEETQTRGGRIEQDSKGAVTAIN